MAIGNISIIKGQGGLQRRSESEDGISGLLFYTDSIPTGFEDDAVKQIFSTLEAESLGITATDAKIERYHIDEFFRLNPAGSLYVGFFETPEGGETPSHDFSEVVTMAREADGRIRQIGIYTTLPFVIGQVAALQAKCVQLENEHMPLSAVLSPDISGQDLTGLPSIRTSNAPNVSVSIAQDISGKGGELFESEGHTIGAVGAILGALSRAAVNEPIDWPDKFPFGGAQLESPGYGEGSRLKDLSHTQINELDTKGYLSFVTYPGFVGTFMASDWTASNGDYDMISRQRTFDKVRRGVRAALIPHLNRPTEVNADGTLQESVTKFYEVRAGLPLRDMQVSREISQYSVFVDPDQKVNTDNTIRIVVSIIPTGKARIIEVTMGFTLNLA